MGRFEGKVAVITGAARGQGRSHAVRLAQGGADIIAIDLCKPIDSLEYPLSSPQDLQETVALIEGEGRKVAAFEADVRDAEGLKRAIDDGVTQLGAPQIVLANAGIMPVLGKAAFAHQAWLDAIDVMLTGVVNTIDASIPHMLEAGQGGSIVITSSTAGFKGYATSPRVASKGLLGYVAAKHGAVGVMRFYAGAYASENIRVNTVHPTGVNTPMVANEGFGTWVAENQEMVGALRNLLPVELIEAADVTNVVEFLCTDEARYITGVALPVDAGFVVK